MKQIPIEQATPAQLRRFASEHLGIEIHPNTPHAAVRAKVAAAWEKPEIPVPDDDESPPEEAAAGAPPRPVTAQQKSKPKKGMVRVYIPVTDEPGGKDAIPVGVNGTLMLVPRGRECDIPMKYYEVLVNAIKYVYDQIEEPGQPPKLVRREVPAFPITVRAVS